jgi:hypothetical protein
MGVTWLEAAKLFPTAIGTLEQTTVVLDIGCGIQPQRHILPQVHICCEPFSQYIEVLQERIRREKDRTYVVLNATWADALTLFPVKSVDTVFLNDVVEHLEKRDAMALLAATERIARRQIAVFTPLGFMPQQHPDGKDAWGLDGGSWQEHKSGWQPEDFDASWSVFASKVFHLTDSMGKVLEEPFGALWAIKTFPGDKFGAASPSVRQRLHAGVNVLCNVLERCRSAVASGRIWR